MRLKNVADTANYVAQVQAIGNALVESETLDAEAWRLERIALGLRTTEGIPLVTVGCRGPRETLRI